MQARRRGATRRARRSSSRTAPTALTRRLAPAHREPVNSMNLDVWEQLSGACPAARSSSALLRWQAGNHLTARVSAAAALDELEKDRSVRGVVICSGLKKDIFTAGCATRRVRARQSLQRLTATNVALRRAATTSRSCIAKPPLRSGTRASGTRRRGAWCAAPSCCVRRTALD